MKHARRRGRTHRLLRRIRQLALPFAEWAVPISSFIRRSQTEHDRGFDLRMQTILYAVDHIELGLVGGDECKPESRATLDRLSRLTPQGAKLLLLLGRFEGLGYKNSRAAYDMLRQVCQQIPEGRLLLLDAGEDCGVPQKMSSLVEISRWEGFNLPVVEMQWLRRPAVAFNLGGHPEVIADPWLLYEDEGEMASKLITSHGWGGAG